MAEERIELPQGTLDLLILKALALESMHGWVKAHWATSENNRRARYYTLTLRGQKQLQMETATWRKLTSAVAHVLDMA
jgi:PadR family transcriptional regulator, regulatory protein PadR